jgi:O-antigen/teichoic acid export membrane protein
VSGGPHNATPMGSSLRSDLTTAYAAAGARIASWAVVSALVYRLLGPDHFAVLALVRGTLGILNYTALGLAPALVHHLPNDPQSLPTLYKSARAVTLLAAVVGAGVAAVYGTNVTRLHHIPPTVADAMALAITFGLSIVLRLASEPSGAMLQVRGRISLDNVILAVAELNWVIAAGVLLPVSGRLGSVGWAALLSGAFLYSARSRLAAGVTPRTPARVDWRAARMLLGFGLLVTLSQLADFLYAPVDQILINRFLDPRDVAAYAPALQIDAALLVLVAGISATLLPRAALAHGRRDVETLRRYYVRGTLTSFALLTATALLVWALSPFLLKLWLKTPPPQTEQILPLVLIHTVIGGSSAVGRSILLAMGRVKPYATSALIAGLANVVLSYVFAVTLKLGLSGIVYGTVTVVVARCVLWMPPYVLFSLRGQPRDVGDGGDGLVGA